MKVLDHRHRRLRREPPRGTGSARGRGGRGHGPAGRADRQPGGGAEGRDHHRLRPDGARRRGPGSCGPPSPDRVFHLAGAAVVGTSWALRADVLRTNLEATYQTLRGPAPPSGSLPRGLLRRGLRRRPRGRAADPREPAAGPRSRPTPCRRRPRSSTRGTTPAPRDCRWSSSAPSTTSAPGRGSASSGATSPGRSPRSRRARSPRSSRSAPRRRGGTSPTSATWCGRTGSCWPAASPGSTYNAASGKAMSIQEVIDGFLGAGRAPDRGAPGRRSAFAPSTSRCSSGDASRLRALTGWAPTISLRQSLEDVLDDWRRRV